MVRASGACTSSVRRADDRLEVHQKADRQVPPTVACGPGELIAGFQRLNVRSRKGIHVCPLWAGPPATRDLRRCGTVLSVAVVQLSAEQVWSHQTSKVGQRGR